ncbi:MAG: SURF1 family protein [Acidobacteriota bacterium]
MMSFKAQRAWILLAAVSGAGLTGSLGMWQLRRADQKTALAQQAAQHQHEAPWHNRDWPCSTQVPPTWPEQRPVSLTGHWLADKVVYLDNRAMDGQAGFFVVTPLQLDPPPACGRVAVLVQRGWLPRHAQDRLKLPPASTPPGLVEVNGHLAAEVHRSYELGQEVQPALGTPGPLLRQNMSRADWLAWLGASPGAGAVIQTDPTGQPASAAPTVDHLKRAWPAPDTGVGKHHAYAAQWFAMALIITGLYVWFQLLRPSRTP